MKTAKHLDIYIFIVGHMIINGWVLWFHVGLPYVCPSVICLSVVRPFVFSFPSDSLSNSQLIFSSPEPKAQGELLWSLTLRRHRPSFRPQSLNNIS